MRNKLILAITLAFTQSSAYAFFCPSNFNQINFGESIESVKQKCGAPDKEKKEEATANVPQQWSYYVPATVAKGANLKGQGTLKTSFTFDKAGKAINISVNGIGVGSSAVCGSNISLGATREQVETACGKPAFINKQEKEESQGAQAKTPPELAKEDDKNKVIEWTYNSTPPVTLIFREGKLTEKR